MSLNNTLSKAEVIPFTSRKTLARSRKRNEALSVIIPHILGALAAYGRPRRWGNDICSRARRGQYVIESCAMQSGLLALSLHRAEGRRFVTHTGVDEFQRDH
jgi:hypothetical protein